MEGSSPKKCYGSMSMKQLATVLDNVRVTGPSDVTLKTKGPCQSGRDTIRNPRSSKSTIVHRLKVEYLPRSWTIGIFFLFTSARD